jgi:hypothetical protein
MSRAELLRHEEFSTRPALIAEIDEAVPASTFGDLRLKSSEKKFLEKKFKWQSVPSF